MLQPHISCVAAQGHIAINCQDKVNKDRQAIDRTEGAAGVEKVYKA